MKQEEEQNPDIKDTIGYDPMEALAIAAAAGTPPQAEAPVCKSPESDEMIKAKAAKTLVLGEEDPDPVLAEHLEDRQPEEPFAPTPTPPKVGKKEEDKEQEEEEEEQKNELEKPEEHLEEQAPAQEEEEEPKEEEPQNEDNKNEEDEKQESGTVLLEVDGLVKVLEKMQGDGVVTLEEAIVRLQTEECPLPVTTRIDQFKNRPPLPKAKGKGKGKGKGKVKAKAKAKAKAKGKARGRGRGGQIAQVEIADSQEEPEEEIEDFDSPEEPAPRHVPPKNASKEATPKASGKGKAKAKSQPKEEKIGDEKTETPKNPQKKGVAEKSENQDVETKKPKKRAKTEEDPKKRKDTKKATETEKEKNPNEHEIPEEKTTKKNKRKTDEEEDEPAAKKARAKPGEASSFARRPCPTTSPAKTRWFAIRDTYKNDVEKRVEKAGANARAWEDCFFGGGFGVCFYRPEIANNIYSTKSNVLSFRRIPSSTFFSFFLSDLSLEVRRFQKTLRARKVGGLFACRLSRTRLDILMTSTIPRLRNHLWMNLSMV